MQMFFFKCQENDHLPLSMFVPHVCFSVAHLLDSQI